METQVIQEPTWNLRDLPTELLFREIALRVSRRGTEGQGFGTFGSVVRISDTLQRLQKILNSKRHSRAKKEIQFAFGDIIEQAAVGYVAAVPVVEKG
jgi:hypothetical protein